jgi:hypothetical protein
MFSILDEDCSDVVATTTGTFFSKGLIALADRILGTTIEFVRLVSE